MDWDAPAGIRLEVPADDPAEDPVMALRRHFDRELAVLTDSVLEAVPGTNPVSLASLMIDYGIELGLMSGLVPAVTMADYLRALADAIDTGAPVWPTLLLEPIEPATDTPF